MSYATDQAEFMRIGGQTVGEYNGDQMFRYVRHIKEELNEIMQAWAEHNDVKLLDGLVDTIVVCVGAIHSMGVDPDAAWAAVHRANMSKFEDGKPVYRADGQIGKGKNFRPPEEDLMALLHGQLV